MSDRKRNTTRAVRTQRRALAASIVALAALCTLYWGSGLHVTAWQDALILGTLIAWDQSSRLAERAKWEHKEQAGAPKPGTIRLGPGDRGPHFTLTGKLADDWEVTNWTTTHGINPVEGTTIKAHVTLTPRRK